MIHFTDLLGFFLFFLNIGNNIKNVEQLILKCQAGKITSL